MQRFRVVGAVNNALVTAVMFAIAAGLAWYVGKKAATVDQQLLQQWLNGFYLRGEAAGLSVHVSLGGKHTHVFSGLADIENQRPVTADTLFRVCSFTKPVTAVAIMQLVEKGKLRLDDDIALYLPEFAHDRLKVVQICKKNDKNDQNDATDAECENGYRLVENHKPITIRHLLTHTSGLVYRFFDELLSMFGGPPANVHIVADIYRSLGVHDGCDAPTNSGDLRSNVRLAAQAPLAAVPGSEPILYGLGYEVLGAIIEEVTQQSVHIYFRDNIFEPLGMHNTFFHIFDAGDGDGNLDNKHEHDNEKGDGAHEHDALLSPLSPLSPLSRLAELYYRENGSSPLISAKRATSPRFRDGSLSPYTGARVYQSSGCGLLSTGADFLRFADMLLHKGQIPGGRRVLSAKSVEQITHKHVVDPWLGPGWHYGLGLTLGPDNMTPRHSQLARHAGLHMTSFVFDRKCKFSAVILAQCHMLSGCSAGGWLNEYVDAVAHAVPGCV